ncbi:MAG: VOC family protein [Candidatus Taylorbacteria bacterium]
MKINEIAFVTYGVKDMPRARKFYEETLGLKPTSVWEGEKMAFIEYSFGKSGVHTLAIGKGAKNFKPGKGGATVGLEMDNFDSAIESLKKNKVKFIMQPYDTGGCDMAIIADPDGNQLMIHKIKSKSK